MVLISRQPGIFLLIKSKICYLCEVIHTFPSTRQFEWRIYCNILTTKVILSDSFKLITIKGNQKRKTVSGIVLTPWMLYLSECIDTVKLNTEKTTENHKQMLNLIASKVSNAEDKRAVRAKVSRSISASLEDKPDALKRLMTVDKTWIETSPLHIH